MAGDAELLEAAAGRGAGGSVDDAPAGGPLRRASAIRRAGRAAAPPAGPQLRKRVELAGGDVEAEDAAFLDDVVPAVQAQVAALDALADGRKGHQPLDLQRD